MKNFAKLMALVLACLMILSLLASCDNGKTNDETETKAQNESVNADSASASEEETEYLPDVDRNNYGEEFYLQAYGGAAHMQYLWVEERDQNIVTEAVYDRCQKVQE